MKNTILLLAIILSINLLSAQEYKDYYNNGNLKEVGQFDTNEKITGEWKQYYENGQLSNIGKYENGEKTGEWKKYDDNGSLSTEIYWKNTIDGARADYFKIYHKTGELNYIISNISKDKEYKKTYDKEVNLIGEGYRSTWNHKLIGEWKFYHKNGSLELKGNYTNIDKDNNGKYDGKWIGYHNNGKIYTTKQWKNGKLLNVISCYDGKGNQLEKGTLVNGNGTVNNYDIDGNLIRTDNVINGEIQK